MLRIDALVSNISRSVSAMSLRKFKKNACRARCNVMLHWHIMSAWLWWDRFALYAPNPLDPAAAALEVEFVQRMQEQNIYHICIDENYIDTQNTPMPYTTPIYGCATKCLHLKCFVHCVSMGAASKRIGIDEDVGCCRSARF